MFDKTRRPNCNRRSRGPIYLWTVAILFGGAGHAVAAPPVVECHFVDEPVTVDGVANEPAWEKAPVVDGFGIPWLTGDQARPPRSATRAQLLWDRDALYFFADMDDTDLYADVVEHDGKTWFNDVFELFFKPADDKPGYYELQVNAQGTRMDLFLPQRGAGGYDRFKSDGDFGWQAQVVRRGTLDKWTDRDQGWSVEGRIPWRDFLRTGGRPSPGEQWKFALCRYDYSVDVDGPELSSCAPLTAADFHRYEDYSSLSFVGPNSAHAVRPYGIDSLPPLTTSRVVGSPEPPLPYRISRAYPKLQLSLPISSMHEPGSDRIWFFDLAGPNSQSRLHRFVDRPEVSEYETLWSPDRVAYGIAFHPDYEKNGYVFIGGNGPGATSPAKHTRVSRFSVGRKPPFAFDPTSEKVILEWESDGHNGGDLGFGLDGMLYVTSGDGTSDSDTNVTGQNMSLLLAKLLRIDVDRPAPGKTYAVPKDNPFVDMAGVRPETWAYGFRNPWRLTVDRKTGAIWVGNNGQDLWEQAFRVERGANYGWSVMEGSHPFYPNRQAGPTPFVKPTVEHPHSEARSLTGGVVYYGDKLPELRGAYIYGDYSTGKIWGVRHDGQSVTWHRELADTTLQITGFGVDSHGELLISDHRGAGEGAFYRLEVNPAKASPSQFPRTLSETGLFASVPGHKLQPSLVPFSVNAPLWSDGAHKERWLGIPHKAGEDRRIELTAARGWNFPNETVLVKSFALEAEAGNPASRRWIETRFLTRQEGEWVGYTYIWNDAQTEAMLAPSAGVDREFEIRVPRSAQFPDGVKKQAWRFPSRTECMVCHSRAANYVLGLTTLQTNKDHDYGGRVDNQLRTFEHLGLLRAPYLAEELADLRQELQAQGLDGAEVDAQVATLTASRDQRAGATDSTLLARAPETIPKLVDPYDDRANLNARARSYLHANCAPCHVEAGGGNAQMQLEFSTPDDKTNLFGVKPVHHKFDLPDARLVAPGAPERSVLLHRLGIRGAGQMPQLATTLVDERAVEMLRAWIASLPPAPHALPAEK